MDNILYKGKNIDSSKFFRVFRLIAGTQLRDCTAEGFPCLQQFERFLVGEDSEVTAEILANTLLICTGNSNGNVYSMQSAVLVGQTHNAKGIIGDIDINQVLKGLGDDGNAIESEVEYTEDDEVLGVDFSGEDEVEDEVEEEDSLSEDEELEQETMTSEQIEAEDKYLRELAEREAYEEEKRRKEEEDEQQVKEEENPTKEAMCRYYSSFYTATIANLLKKYTALFESGYEVNSPDGILCKDGIVQVVGSHRKIYEDSIATTEIYNLITSHLPVKEKASRSISKIGNDIYNEYTSSRNLLYFPNKMLEFAYGLEAPTGENQDSLNTYNRHAKASSWGSFKSGELEKSIRFLCKNLLYGFIVQTMEASGIENYKDSQIANQLQSYMEYVEKCMSICFLFVDYKFDKVAGEGQLSKFVLRVCDPSETLLGVNLTQDIIREAFLRNNGKDAYSYQNRVDRESYMVEFAHEFNHALAQATPLFAYKALQALIKDGKAISWDNLILGKGEDGKILKCGKEGFINLAVRLLHFISAGSRAGKGVMTLNFLASAISDFKLLFYLDRKPDMASILKMICPEMFVVNGGGYDAEMDAFKQWGPVQVGSLLNNVPKEIYDILDCSVDWDSLGDLFYMRALMLVVGIIVGRASGHGTDAEWGGSKGVTLIVDEFSNFQNSYRIILNKMYAKIPDIKLNESRSDLSKEKISQADFDAKYNDAAYYALSYVNALASSLDFLDVKGRAGFDALEVGRSDIIVIGQHLKDTPVNVMEYSRSFEQSTSSYRYQTKLSRGMKGAFNEKVNMAISSVPLSMISFHSSGSDAFLGRNDQGYLAADKGNSKAHGRLDDKASNFAYYNNLTANVLRDLHSNDITNIKLANECKYFKPYLILNDGDMNSSYVQGVINRCQSNAGITKEELIADNPDDDNPNIMHKAIGFLEYIKMAGVTDYDSSLKGGAAVAQMVVSKLGYPGTWLEFVCDLRPEWIFTIKDIENIAQNKTPALNNPMSNPILKEWVDFNPQRFGADYEDPEEASANPMDKFLMSENTMQDYSNPEKVMEDGDERLSNAWNDFEEDEKIYKDDGKPDDFEDDYENLESDEGLDLGLDDDYEEEKPVELESSPVIHETGFAKSEMQVTPEMEALFQLVEQLQNQILEMQQQQANQVRVTTPVDGKSQESSKVNPIESELEREYEYSYKSTESTEFGEEFVEVDYEDEIDSLDKLITLISTDIVEKFGGLDRFTSLKVIGGSLVINGYYYRCNIKDMYASNIPYDIRRKINSGNIAELFNYNLLFRMPRMRKLTFDSMSFVYDYVSPQLGMSDNIGVDVFFKSLPALQELIIAKQKFTRGGYQNQLESMPNGDVFYKVKRSTQLADWSEGYLKKINSNAWSFTKNVAKKKNMNVLLKSAGILAGSAASAASLAARGGMAAGRKVVSTATSEKAKNNVKGFMSGVKDLFKH